MCAALSNKPFFLPNSNNLTVQRFVSKACTVFPQTTMMFDLCSITHTFLQA